MKSPVERFGGVAAKQNWPRSAEGEEPSDLAPARRQRGRHVSPGFTFQGGPVVSEPEIYVTFWGPAWTADAEHQSRQTSLSQFVTDLLQSDYVNIIAQYGVGTGAGHCGSVLGTSNVATPAGTLDEAGIHHTIQAMIDARTIPEPTAPSQTAVVVFLDEGTEINDPGIGVVMCEPNGDNAFGYHYFFTTTAGHQAYYAIIPSLTDSCLQESCPDDTQCSLHLALTQLERQTQVASHEICEMLTDPEINAWRNPKSGAENGDVCNGESGTVTVNGRNWNVQHMYSYADDLQGNPACLLGAPNPIPNPLHP